MSWTVLGLCLLHFLWQGAFIGAFTATLLLCLREATAQIRYVVCCLAMLAMAACPTLTALALAATPEPAEGSLPGIMDFRIIVWVWLVGVGLFAARLIGGFGGYLRLSRVGLTLPSSELQERFEALAKTLQIRIMPRLYLSSRVAVPTAVGLVRGVVLLPASLACGVSPKMLDALLLHELAHISRFDFLANAIQCVAEVLFFYHPAVWWLSKRIRQERENCCDDVVVKALDDRRTYAKALAVAAELRPQTLVLRSDGGDLLARIQRILGKGQARPKTSPVFAGLLLAALLLTPILTGFRSAAPTLASEMVYIEYAGVDGKTTAHAVPLGPGSEVTIGKPGDPLVIDAVMPVEAVDRETALKNGWITPDQ